MRLLSAKGGLWDNILTWVNCLFAGILATNYFEPFAGFLSENIGKDYDWYWDFLGFFLLFALSIGLFRAVTDSISTVRVRFRKPVEIGGSIFFAVVAGWTILMFTTFIVHTAPLATKSFGESFQPTPKSVNFMGLGPDWKRLGFASKQSSPGGALYKGSDYQFDPDADFIKALRFASLPF